MRGIRLLLVTLLSMGISCCARASTSMPKSASEAQDFKLKLRAEGGAPTSEGIYEYVTDYQLDGVSGKAVMVLNRHNTDFPGSIGVYATTLSKEQVAATAQTMETIRWSEVPSLTGGDINGSKLKLSYTRKPLSLTYEFNSWNFEFLQAIAPVMDALNRQMSELDRHPQRVLQVDVKVRVSGDTATPTLIPRNMGTGPLLIVDPRSTIAGVMPTRAYLQLAELPPSVPGVMDRPAVWTTLRFPAHANGGSTIRLEAGSSVSFDSEAFKPKLAQSTRFALQGAFIDYEGPKVDAGQVLPFAPTAVDIDDRPYVIRGAAFSLSELFELPASDIR